MPKAYIGTSGYIYDHWYEVFYPEDLTKDKWLEYYCRFFDTVELNVTFYRLPYEALFKRWYQRVPDDFIFTIKGSRFITHVKKLNDCKEPLELFLSRAKNLKEKLGTILWQLPPRFTAKPEKLEKFCALLRLFGDSLRHSFEFRDESWFSSEIYEILKKNNMALVICDYPFQLTSASKKIEEGKRKVIYVPETADFVYLRRHGATALYSSSYSDEQLEQDASQIKNWLENGKDVYVYFNNDAEGYAVKNALKLKELIK